MLVPEVFLIRVLDATQSGPESVYSHAKEESNLF